MKALIQWFNRNLGMTFNFRGKLLYKVRGKMIAEQVLTVSVSGRSLINDHRSLKKALCKEFIDYLHENQMLDNGELMFEPICYLGYWHAGRKAYNK